MRQTKRRRSASRDVIIDRKIDAALARPGKFNIKDLLETINGPLPTDQQIKRSTLYARVRKKRQAG